MSATTSTGAKSGDLLYSSLSFYTIGFTVQYKYEYSQSRYFFWS